MQNIIKSTIRFCFFILLPLLLFRTLLYEPFIIPSGSMKGTLLIGDYIIASKYAYGYSDVSMPFAPRVITAKPRAFYKVPKRGDVVIFRGMRNGDTNNYIKRVIGLPGDKVNIIDSNIYINDIPIRRTLLGYFAEQETKTQIKEAPMYKEVMKNGKCYSILQETMSGPANNSGPYFVPENSFFVMGDNRDNSGDSRFFGFVPAEKLVGRAERVLISFGKSYGVLPFKIRFERIWKNIRPKTCSQDE